MQEKTFKQFDKDFRELEKSLPGYINPWGFLGGLFGSVLIVLIGLTAYSMQSGLTLNNIGVLVLLIIANGYSHSQTIGTVNMCGARHHIDNKMIKELIECMDIMSHVTKEQDEIIKKLKIKLKEVNNNE